MGGQFSRVIGMMVLRIIALAFTVENDDEYSIISADVVVGRASV